MSKIYKKEIIIKHFVDYIKCDGCGYETPFSNAIDCWCIINKKNYCLSCQKKNSVGLYKKQKI